MPRYTLPDHDPETILEWCEYEEEPDPNARCSRTSWIRSLALLWPVGRSTEAVLAECVGQCLIAGLSTVESLELAGRVFRRHRIGVPLNDMAFKVNAGERIHVALKQSPLRVSASFLEAVRVGEDRGHVAAELRAFARRITPNVCQRLIRLTGRSKQAIQFASTLGRLVQDHRLTTTIVQDAGQVVAGDDKRFWRVVGAIVSGMENGDSLGTALSHFRAHFDPMFVRFVDAPTSRTALRINLNLLANDQTA